MMDIVLENVTAGYGFTPVLDSISLKISEGERVLVAGTNGSGKTTLLRVIARLLPFDGRVTYGTSDSGSIRRKELASVVSYMPQNGETYFDYTVEQTVMLGRYSHMTGLLASPGSEDRKIAAEAMNRCGVYELRYRALNELSGGQLQRTFLARAFAQQTPFMLLDEPENNLDVRHNSELTDYLNEWASGTTELAGASVHNTVVAVMHDLGQASLCLERVIALDKGIVAYDGSINDMVATGRISDIFGFDVTGYKRRESKLWNLCK